MIKTFNTKLNPREQATNALRLEMANIDTITEESTYSINWSGFGGMLIETQKIAKVTQKQGANGSKINDQSFLP